MTATRGTGADQGDGDVDALSYRFVMSLPNRPAWRCAMPNRHEFIPADPNLLGRNVKLPRQARVALEHAEALVAGRPPRPVAVDAASLTDAQIDAVLER